jgi:hypothetical protein
LRPPPALREQGEFLIGVDVDYRAPVQRLLEVDVNGAVEVVKVPIVIVVLLVARDYPHVHRVLMLVHDRHAETFGAGGEDDA